MTAWIQGAPSVTLVQQHENAHAVGEREGGGAQWICHDPRWPGVHVLRLKVIDGRVNMANGIAFWQPLDEARWAARSRYRPVDAEGVEVGDGAPAHLAPQPPPVEGTARPTWIVVVGEALARAGETSGDEERGWRLVARDGHARGAEGVKKHGRPHQSDNGRDHAADAYQEELDRVCYWRAEADVAHLLGDETRATEAWALYQEALRFAHRARLYLLRRDGR
ncbi:hypothetical protein [Myxococcus phage Mx4 ts27htf-1hrm-1]|nr:hypothetical protein Mx4_p38 [Myxococcus phage Mx4]WNM70378.1 hypothetical protein [Myxococcus phage Mx4 ts27htf-1hrm-1]